MFLEQFPNTTGPAGWIEVICGSMFSGKTEELIRRLKRAEFAQQRILLIKPTMDTRYGTDKIVSHQGVSVKATSVMNSAEILSIWTEEAIVAIDEAQFFDDSLVATCVEMASKGARVIVAGLDMDFKGHPFGPIPDLLAAAEYITKVHAICVNCGNLAQFSHRKSADKALVVLGEKEHYEPLCRGCYNETTR